MSQEFRPPPMSLAQRAALHARQTRTEQQTHRQSRAPSAGAIVLFVVALAVAATGGFEYAYRDRIYPNVSVRGTGLNIGGLTRVEATARLDAFRQRQLFRFVRLHAAGMPVVSVQAYKLGYSTSRFQTILRAYHVGRSGSLFARAVAQASALGRGAAVSPVQSIDAEHLRRYLTALARKTRRGRNSIDVPHAMRLLQRHLLTTGGFALTLPLRR